MEPTSVLNDPSKNAAQPRGFTLIEMLVVLAIIVIITAIVITGQSAFNRTIILTDTAYNIAFSAREAQSYGLSSRKFGSVQNPGYGLHFDRVTPGSYTFFADTAHNSATPWPSTCPLGTAGTPSQKPGDCRFTSSDGTVSTYTFSRGYTISKFCGKTGSRLYCSTDSSPLTSLDMVFTRPNTSTTISGPINGSSVSTTFTCAQLTLTDQSKQATKTIRVSSLGEVSIGQTCP